jgi:putative phosphoribosyl transferase
MDEQIVVLPGGPGLDADLHLPAGAGGMVVFAHGSGSSRRSGRNIQVARELQRAGLATLLFDLLTGDEERRDAVDASLRFDIPFLTDRLTAVVDEIVVRPPVAGLPVGLFGASTGAAAALGTAAARPGVVHSVVSRGGRPDLAAEALSEVRVPTLLLVGSLDRQVIALNEQAAARLPAEHQLSIIPGATHLFEEPGTLEEVARQAAAWFVRTLPPAPR